jgi:hypothetical protein
MPAVSLSRVGARVVESGPGGQDLAAGAWERLEALPDPRSRPGGLPAGWLASGGSEGKEPSGPRGRRAMALDAGGGTPGSITHPASDCLCPIAWEGGPLGLA